MAFHCFSKSIVLAIVLCFKTLYASSDKKWDPTNRVQLTSDGPTTLGATTTLSAQVVHYGGQAFRFTFRYFGGDIVKEVKSHVCNLTISNWSTSKEYKVTLIAERTKPNYQSLGEISIYVTVTDRITANLKATPSKDLYVGPVLLSVHIHDPSHFFDKVIYSWDFGDGTYMNNTQIGKLSHNFTQIKTYHVKVTLFAMAKGTLYNGAARRDLTFDVNFDPSLTVIDSRNISTLTLPFEDSKITYVALGRQVQLIVKYNNPYGIVQKCTAQWSIGSYGRTACNLKYTFTMEGEKYVFITPTFETMVKNKSDNIFQKKLIVQAPLSNLTLVSKNYTSLTKYLEANISCQGSAPFMVCWKLSRYSSSRFGDPLIDNCTGLSQTCRFQINRTISYKGTFQLDITVINRVGSANLLEHFTIPNVKPPVTLPHHHRAKTAAVSAVVPIVICIILAVILICVVRKVYTIRHRSILETANFDFRDEDCQSVNSLYLGNKWCPFFKFWKKNKEYYPLLESWNKHNTSSFLYSDILYNDNNNNNNVI